MTEDALSELEDETLYILREARRRYRRPALLWSMGKDSTTLLSLARKAFFGELPFPVLHIDTSYKFQEMYAYRDQLAREWGLSLIIYRNEEALAQGMGPWGRSKLACCTALKTEALRQAVELHGFDAVLLGIRADEHGVRAKERIFSPRGQDFRWEYGAQAPELWDLYPTYAGPGQHVRVHPLLRWREIDIWRYLEREALPLVPLYFSRAGERFRSIGCRTCCTPVMSQAATTRDILSELEVTREGERAGRAQDKEDSATMQKLRALGYM